MFRVRVLGSILGSGFGVLGSGWKRGFFVLTPAGHMIICVLSPRHRRIESRNVTALSLQLAGCMTASRVEDLRAWQLTYKFKLGVYQIMQGSSIASDFELRDE
jgi:hypothetical protein